MSEGAAAPVEVLLVEDNPGDVELVERALEGHAVRFRLTTVSRLEEAQQVLARDNDIAVVLLDLHLPDSQGLATYRSIRDVSADTPVVVYTVLGDEEQGVAAVREGAQDFLVKANGNHTLLPRSLRYAIERQRIVEDLRALQDDMREFFAHVAHDLRDPVTAVAGLADLITDERASLPDAELDRLLASVRNQARRLSAVVNDVVDLAKADREPDLQLIDLRQLVTRSVADVPPPDDVSVEIDAEDGLCCEGEPARLERVFTNLLTNAYRYGGDHVRISVTSRGDEAVVTVEDDGEGVPEEFVPGLFESFRQGPNATGGQGTGLGLSIVQRFVTSMNGAVSYRLGADGGAVFEVTLPLAQADD